MEELQDHSAPIRTNWFKRGIGIAVCFTPAFLLLASLGHWIEHRTSGFGSFAIVTALAALFVGVVNSYFSFIRPWLYLRQHGSWDEFKHVSAVPMWGTLLVMVADYYGFGELPTAILALLATALDTGGLPWFLIASWHDSGLWDERSPSARD